MVEAVSMQLGSQQYSISEEEVNNVCPSTVVSNDGIASAAEARCLSWA